MNWRKKQYTDPYYQKAKSEGYRSRAAYKLIEIQQKFKIIKENSFIIDLGCTPGGWLQVVRKWNPKFVVGVDLEKIQPIQGVNFVQMDFNKQVELANALDNFKSSIADSNSEMTQNIKFDLILSDMLPKITGSRDFDYYQSIELVEQVYNFTNFYLKQGGFMVCKILEGSETSNLIKNIQSGQRKMSVRIYKPEASRSESREMYLICSSKN